MAGYFKEAESSGEWREEFGIVSFFSHCQIPVSCGVFYEGTGLMYLQNEASTFGVVVLIHHSAQCIIKVWDLLIDNTEWLLSCRLLACFLMPLASVSPSVKLR